MLSAARRLRGGSPSTARQPADSNSAWPIAFASRLGQERQAGGQRQTREESESRGQRPERQRRRDVTFRRAPGYGVAFEGLRGKSPGTPNLNRLPALFTRQTFSTNPQPNSAQPHPFAQVKPRRSPRPSSTPPIGGCHWRGNAGFVPVRYRVARLRSETRHSKAGF